MPGFSSGLSLILGRALLDWCDSLGEPSLERYMDLGGFQGLQRVKGMSAQEVVSELRASGLRERAGHPDPVYWKWQRFSRRQDPGVLVVDALEYDPLSQSGPTLLGRNPFALVEGVLMAMAATGAAQVKMLLPPELEPQEAQLLNTLEQVQARGLTGGAALDVELVRGIQPSILDSGPVLPQEWGSALVHSLSTWYHVTLALAVGAEVYSSLGMAGQSGTRLITLEGEVRKPGLVEAPLGADLWTLVETMGGGIKPGKVPLALAVDNGMGGFLPPAAARVALSPEELIDAGVNPGLDTIRLLETGQCVVDLTRRVLYRYWQLSGDEFGPRRNLITRALRLVVEITRGKGLAHHLDELDRLARSLAAESLVAAWPLATSLRYFREQWVEHLQGGRCPGGICLQRPLAPCHNTCPAGIDIPSFLALIGHHRYTDAAESIVMDNPLPYSCGLVCPAPCEGVCLRQEVDQSIQIRAMKAVAARHTLEGGSHYLPEIPAQASGKKVAVVGSGPAGLTAAWFLARMGHQVTIFEAQHEAGGMLRYGIPAYRLPREALDAEVEEIRRLGVEILTDQEVESIAQLRGRGFDAYFLAVGTQLSRMIPVEGADQPFVLGGLDFLKAVRRGENPAVGPRVVVVGGGNVAIDVALSALRQGGKRVDMVCLEKRREMPAHVSEVETAIAEGVEIHNSWGPLKISPNHEMSFMRCARVFDEKGRFNPSFDRENQMTLKGDHIILAIGQATDLACVEQGSEVEVQRGLICADPDTLATREPGVFAGGDVVSGPRTVVEAVGAGKRAAHAIDAYLKGEDPDPAGPARERRAEVEPVGMDAERRTNQRRAEIPVLDVKDRQGNYQQVELGLDDDKADDEAGRCLRCDLCIGCGLCQLVCSEVGAEALRLKETGADRLAFREYTRPSTRCIGCGACSQVCPTGAIKVYDRNGKRVTSITGTVVREHDLLICSRCGESYGTNAYINHLKARGGPAYLDHLDRHICPSCARVVRAEELSGGYFFNLTQS